MLVSESDVSKKVMDIAFNWFCDFLNLCWLSKWLASDLEPQITLSLTSSTGSGNAVSNILTLSCGMKGKPSEDLLTTIGSIDLKLPLSEDSSIVLLNLSLLSKFFYLYYHYLYLYYFFIFIIIFNILLPKDNDSNLFFKKNLTLFPVLFLVKPARLPRVPHFLCLSLLTFNS